MDRDDLSFEEIIQMEQARNTPLFSGDKKRNEEPIGKWEVDFKELLDTFSMKLKGLGFNRKTGKWEEQDGVENQINAIGHNYIMSSLETIAQKAGALTKLSYNQIMDEVLNTLIVFDSMLFRNFNKYEIPDWSVYKLLMDEIRKIILFILMMSLDGWTADNRIKVIQIQELMTNKDNTSKKKGLTKNWGGLF